MEGCPPCHRSIGLGPVPSSYKAVYLELGGIRNVAHGVRCGGCVTRRLDCGRFEPSKLPVLPFRRKETHETQRAGWFRLRWDTGLDDCTCDVPAGLRTGRVDAGSTYR